MRIRKSTFFIKRSCEFGNFELNPERGWKISRKFIDFESGLLVVTESDENKANWTDTGFGSQTIPTKEHKINTKTGEILTTEEWMAYFSYKTIEQLSTDGKYKLKTTRVHEPERNSDSIKETLIELKSGKTLLSSSSIAFNEDKGESLLESFYREQKEHEERKAALNAMPTLSELFKKELEKLNQGDVILEYYDSEYIFKLVYTKSVFTLLKVHSKFSNHLNVNALNYQQEASYNTIQDFVNKLFATKHWFINYSPINTEQDGSEENLLIKKFVIEFFNELRKKHDFTFDEYHKIQNWENHFYQHNHVNPKEYKQFCFNCKNPVSYNPRYPKYICGNCSSKKIKDEHGLELSFSNVGLSGGLRITYKKDGVVLKEDTNKREMLCFIDTKRFIATEERFGGIVIQSEK